MKYSDSKYCQKCGRETDKLYEIVFEKTVRGMGYGQYRKNHDIKIKICEECKLSHL